MKPRRSRRQYLAPLILLAALSAGVVAQAAPPAGSYIWNRKTGILQTNAGFYVDKASSTIAYPQTVYIGVGNPGTRFGAFNLWSAEQTLGAIVVDRNSPFAKGQFDIYQNTFGSLTKQFSWGFSFDNPAGMYLSDSAGNIRFYFNPSVPTLNSPTPPGLGVGSSVNRSSLDISGTVGFAMYTTTADVNINTVRTSTLTAQLDSFWLLRVDATAGSRSITLPLVASYAASGSTDRRWYRFCKIDASANTVNFAVASGDGLDAASLTQQNECVDLIADTLQPFGTAFNGVWREIGRTVRTPGSGSSPFVMATSTTNLNGGGFNFTNLNTVSVASFTVTGATVQVNGVTMIFPPVVGTGTRLFQVDFAAGKAVISYPLAILDGAETGVYNLFTASNAFSNASGIALDKITGYTNKGSSVTFGSDGSIHFSGVNGVDALIVTALGGLVGSHTPALLGSLQLNGSLPTVEGRILLYEATNNGGNYTMLKPPNDLTKTSEFTLQIDTDTAGYLVAAVGGVITQSSDPEVYTATKTYSVTIATNGVTWDSLSVSLGAVSATRSATIRSVWVYVSSGTSLAFNIDKRTAGSEASVGTNITSGSITATTTGAATTVFSSASLAANDQLFFKTATSAASGTVFSVTIEIRYTN